ncbi:hypothetical protein [Streptomyces phage phiScoe44]|nr:hypothetical protein [Streptomyces phage phiScoe44]
MKTRTKILSVLAFGALAFGAGTHNAQTAAAPAPAVKVETVASAKPTPLPAVTKYIEVKVPTGELPTNPCSDEGGRNCYWDGGKELNGKSPSYWVDRNGVVTYLNPKWNDTVKRLTWEAGQRKAGHEKWGTVEGHRDCWAKIGDTSYVYCWDGYRTTS